MFINKLRQRTHLPLLLILQKKSLFHLDKKGHLVNKPGGL